MKWFMIIWRFLFPPRIRNQSLNRSPRVRNGRFGKRVIIKGDIQTPFRIHLIDRFVFQVLQKLWGSGLFLLIIDFILVALNIFPVLKSLGLDQSELLMLVIVTAMLYKIEMAMRLPFFTWLLGCELTVIFTPKYVIVKGRGRTKRFDRSHRLSFAYSGFSNPRRQAYKDSRAFEIVIDDVRTVRLCEFYNVARVSQFTVNCNFINGTSLADRDRAIDPRAQHLEGRA